MKSPVLGVLLQFHSDGMVLLPTALLAVLTVMALLMLFIIVAWVCQWLSGASMRGFLFGRGDVLVFTQEDDHRITTDLIKADDPVRVLRFITSYGVVEPATTAINDRLVKIVADTRGLAWLTAQLVWRPGDMSPPYGQAERYSRAVRDARAAPATRRILAMAVMYANVPTTQRDDAFAWIAASNDPDDDSIAEAIIDLPSYMNATHSARWGKLSRERAVRLQFAQERAARRDAAGLEPR